jgi:PilZ domain-containing protein
MDNGGERRGRASRQKTFLRATIEGDERGQIECVVVDLSETGARIALPDPTLAPDHFRLSIPARKLEKTCRLVHRSADTIGVMFIEKKNIAF